MRSQNNDKAIRSAKMVAGRVARAPGGSLSDAINSFSQQRNANLTRPAASNDAALMAMLQPRPQLAVAEPVQERQGPSQMGQMADLGAEIDKGARFLEGKPSDDDDNEPVKGSPTNRKLEDATTTSIAPQLAPRSFSPKLASTKSYGSPSSPPSKGDATSIKGVSTLDAFPHNANVDLGHLNPTFSSRLGSFLTDAQAAGINTRIISGYRDNALQAKLWANYQARKAGQAIPYPNEGSGGIAAPPGSSYHNYGNAVDMIAVDSKGNYSPAGQQKLIGMVRGNPNYGLTAGADFGDTPHFQLGGHNAMAGWTGAPYAPPDVDARANIPAVKGSLSDYVAHGGGNGGHAPNIDDDGGSAAPAPAPVQSAPLPAPSQPAQQPPTPAPAQQPPPSLQNATGGQQAEADPMSNLYNRVALMPDVQSGYDSPSVLYQPDQTQAASGGAISRMPTNELIAEALRRINRRRAADGGSQTQPDTPQSSLQVMHPGVLMNGEYLLQTGSDRGQPTYAWEGSASPAPSTPSPQTPTTPTNSPAIPNGQVGNASGTTGSPIGGIPNATPNQVPASTTNPNGPQYNNTLDQALGTNNPTMEDIFGFNYPKIPPPNPQPVGPIPQSVIDMGYGMNGAFASGGAIIMDALNRARKASKGKRHV